MYTKPNCPYCAQAREALHADGTPFEERDATTRADWKAELMRYSRGTGMVPTIVVGLALPGASLPLFFDTVKNVRVGGYVVEVMRGEATI